VNKADGEKLVLIHIYLVVLYLMKLSSLVLNSYNVQQHVEVTRWSFIFRLPKTGNAIGKAHVPKARHTGLV
jgi:hypothetical protein